MMKSANTFCQKVPTPRDLKLKNSDKSLNLFGRSERIRTSDPLLPKQVRYQAALRSDTTGVIDERRGIRKRIRPAERPGIVSASRLPRMCGNDVNPRRISLPKSCAIAPVTRVLTPEC